MSTLRLVLIAVFSWVGLSLAEAQAPPPVPALPDTPRLTSYSLSGSTCACAVNFSLYGDSTDYWDWLEVWINGVLAPYNGLNAWTITSPTGPLATIPRPINDAVLTFASPVTGTVQIVGARRPRRASQFTESRGVPARDLNQIITDIIAMLREDWDKINDVTGRVLMTQPGNVMGPLPLPVQCSNGYIKFDATGLTPGCSPGVPNVGPIANLAALKALSPTFGPLVHRDGYLTAGDGGGAYYVYSSLPCSLNGGNGDNGYQVIALGGGCWTADAPGNALDVRVWGAVSDGITDAGGIINIAEADFPGTVIIPATNLGFYINTSVIDTGSIKGTSFQPYNSYNGSTLLYPGTSWLQCSRTVNPCVQVGTKNLVNNLFTGAQLEDVLIVGAFGSPNANVVGLQFVGGFNATTRNVAVYNFDTCVEWGPAVADPDLGNISTTSYNLFVAMCKTHHFVNDGVPETRVIGGRAGFNGAGDYGAADDYVYITHTTNVNAGGGPNTILFDDYHFNTSGGLGCAVRFGAWTGTGGVQAEFRFTNDHFEFHSYSGIKSQGIFCSDATVAGIQQLFVTNMVTGTGGITVPAFNFAAATYLGQAYFSNNSWGCSSTTYTPAAAPNAGSGTINFSHNLFCGNVTLTANTNISAFLDHNSMNALAIGGNWAFFSSDDDLYASLTDTANGHVSWSNPNMNVWTPILTFPSGTPTYTSGGYWTRTPNGGVKGYYTVTVTAKNASAGTATITGFPHSCTAGGGSQAMSNVANLAGITGIPTSNLVTTTINLYQGAAAGVQVLTDANFTDTSVLAGMVECVVAQ